MPGHEKDLELARACERGDETAWDRFIAEHRPILYRSADAIDPSGGAREVADLLYGELYGLKEIDGKRKSLFAYFQGAAAWRHGSGPFWRSDTWIAFVEPGGSRNWRTITWRAHHRHP